MVPGTHLLVADEPDAIAASCVRASRNVPVREATTGAAFQLYEARYSTDVVSDRVGVVASRVMDRHAGDDRGPKSRAS